MNKTFYYFCFWFFIYIDITSCSSFYKAGNLVSLDYPIKTSLKSSLIQSYCDTLIRRYGYNVPAKWQQEKKLVEVDSISHIRIYFRNTPEEMYLISFGGMLTLNDIYNPEIRNGDWVARLDLMPKNEELRIKQRFQHEILDVIEKMAKDDGLPDSVIYR